MGPDRPTTSFATISVLKERLMNRSMIRGGLAPMAALLLAASVGMAADYRCGGTGVTEEGDCITATLIDGEWVNRAVPKGTVIAVSETVQGIGEGWAIVTGS
jgi:hypothetical protein